jgi:hypothetical protein
MAKTERRSPPAWWRSWRPGRRLETIAIAWLIVGLTGLSLLAGYRAYQAGLAAVARGGPPNPWLLVPAELGLTLVAGLTLGLWLAGLWLGERGGWRDGLSLLATIGAGGLIAWQLGGEVGLTAISQRLALAGSTPLAVGLGCLIGGWWSDRAAPPQDGDRF